MAVPAKLNQTWSMDFMHDQLADGRRYRLFNVLDDCNREAWVVKWISYFLPSALYGHWIRSLNGVANPRRFGATMARNTLVNCSRNGPESVGSGWNLSNPGKRKTPRGIKRHINSWLTRANDAAPIIHVPPPSNGMDSMAEAYDTLCKLGHDEFKQYCINHDMPMDDIQAVELRFSGKHSYEKAERLAKGIG